MLKVFLLLSLLLLPEIAQAGELDSLGATVIVYSKWIFLLAGIALMTRVVVLAQDGQKIGKTIRIAVAITIIPSLILSVLSSSGSGFQTGDVAAGGRPFLEYMMAQTGLLSASQLAGWSTYNFIMIALVFSSAAAVAAKVAGKNENEMAEGWKSWAIPAALIFAVFNPFYTTHSVNSSGAVVQQIGQSDVKSIASSPGGGSITGLGSDQALPKFSEAKFELVELNGQRPEVPFVLSKINDAFDELTGSLVNIFGTSTFSNFGMTSMKAGLSRLDLKIENPDLKERVQVFADNCFILALMTRKKDPKFAERMTKEAKQFDATIYNPFSDEYMSIYRSGGGMKACEEMVDGKYYFGSGDSAILYPHPLGDEILGNLAFKDQNLKREFSWQNVDAAIKDVPKLKNKIWKNINSKFHYNKIGDAMIADVFWKAVASMRDLSETPTQRMIDENDHPITSWLSKTGMVVSMSLQNMVGAAGQEQITLQLPIWMGGLQMILLACFPIIFLMSLLPGTASTMGYYFLTLLWAKSYVIGWALLSNLDKWLGTISFPPDQQLAVTNAMQQFMTYTPLIMALIIFGPKVAAHSLSKGGGGG